MQPTEVRKESFFGEVLKFSLIALLIVVPIRLYVAQPFVVSGASMEPTFDNGEYLIVDQLTYQFETPDYNDVVIFRYPKDPTKYFIKRIIGRPGDTVSITNGNVTITNSEHPEGFELPQPYLVDQQSFERMTVTLGDSEYFVMGDNRKASSDSRSWGALPEQNIVGRALVRLLPVDHISFFPGAATDQ